MKVDEQLTREQAWAKWSHGRNLITDEVLEHEEEAWLDGWSDAIANSPLPQVVEALDYALGRLVLYEEHSVEVAKEALAK